MFLTLSSLEDLVDSHSTWTLRTRDESDCGAVGNLKNQRAENDVNKEMDNWKEEQRRWWWWNTIGQLFSPYSAAVCWVVSNDLEPLLWHLHPTRSDDLLGLNATLLTKKQVHMSCQSGSTDMMTLCILRSTNRIFKTPTNASANLIYFQPSHTTDRWDRCLPRSRLSADGLWENGAPL